MNFKTILSLIVIFVLGLSKAQDLPKDNISLPGPVDFNGTEYFLVWSKQVSPTLFVQQYLPKDDEIDNYNQMITVSYFNKDIDLEQAIRQKVETLQEIGAKDKFAKIDISENPDGTEYIADFTVSGKTKKESPYIEYSVDRFKKYANKTKSLVIFSYKKRIYGDDLKGSSKAFSKQRNQLLTAAIEFPLPNISIGETENKEKIKE